MDRRASARQALDGGARADQACDRSLGPIPAPVHSMTMPASLISFAHFACSLAMKRPNSAALSSPGSAPLAIR